MTSFLRRLCSAVCALLLGTPAVASQIFVRANAAPGGTGTSWQTAFNELHAALAVAQAGDDVWVAAGTYRPASGTTPFELRSGVALLGGFAGTETRASQRDWMANVTILTGDMLNDDGPGFTNYGDNAAPLCK